MELYFFSDFFFIYVLIADKKVNLEKIKGYSWLFGLAGFSGKAFLFDRVYVRKG